MVIGRGFRRKVGLKLGTVVYLVSGIELGFFFRVSVEVVGWGGGLGFDIRG